MSDHREDTQEMEKEYAEEFRSYLIGGILAVLLTIAAFAVVGLNLLSGLQAMTALAVLAVVQVMVHFRFFMHIDLQKSHRDDLQLILFTTLILGLMVGGTIWILFSRWQRMM